MREGCNYVSTSLFLCEYVVGILIGHGGEIGGALFGCVSETVDHTLWYLFTVMVAWTS